MGLTGRAFGLTCDNVLAVDAVLADGRAVHCDATHDADLYWALRGGGGGNFAIVTGFTFRTHPVNQATLYKFTWPWSLAGKTLAAWMDWIPGLPDEVYSACLLSGARRRRTERLGVGPRARVESARPSAALIAAIGAPATTFTRTHTYTDAMMIEAGCQGVSQAACHFAGSSPGGTLARSAFLAKSDYFTAADERDGDRRASRARSKRARTTRGCRAAPRTSTRTEVRSTASRPTRPRSCTAPRCARRSTAARSTRPRPADHLAANRAWLDAMYASLRPAASGAAYQNYIDPTLTDWRQAYYGANYDRLVAAQRTYDPHRLAAVSLRPSAS